MRTNNAPSIDKPLPRHPGGFSLVELVVATGITSILLVTMGSAIVLSSRAIPSSSTGTNTVTKAARVLELLTDELANASQFYERTPLSISFSVADQDEDIAPEKIRYAWSGTPGDPVTRQYNQDPPTTLLDSAECFNLDYELIPRQRSPRILVVGRDTGSAGPQDLAKQNRFKLFGYAATFIDDDNSPAKFAAAVDTADVAYISEEAWGPSVSTKLKTAPIGVVNEESSLQHELGFSTADGINEPDDRITLVNTTHQITSEFSSGDLRICSTMQSLVKHSGVLTPGAIVLAENDGPGNTPMLTVIESGAALQGGGSALGRRVQLPWGHSAFDFNSLTNDGLTLMRRSIDWAAGSKVVSTIQVGLQPASDTNPKLETKVRIVNKPAVSGP